MDILYILMVILVCDKGFVKDILYIGLGLERGGF